MENHTELHPIDPAAKHYKDWPGMWYELGREQGHNDVFEYISIDPVSQRKKVYFCSHQKADGLGSFPFLQEMIGNQYKFLNVSKKSIPAVSLFQKYASALKCFFKSLQKKELRWKQFNSQKVPVKNKEYRHCFLDSEKTEQLKECAHKRGVSLNSLVLEQVHNTVAPLLLESIGNVQWVFPVNMRPYVQVESKVANCSSALVLELPEKACAKQIQKQIKTKLKSNEHWGVWLLLNIGKIIGKKGMRLLLGKRNKSAFQLGTFSSMGEWSLKDQNSNPDNTLWLVAPPGTANYPVSVGTFIINGRYSLTLKIHPSVRSEAALLDKAIQDIQKRLEILARRPHF